MTTDVMNEIQKYSNISRTWFDVRTKDFGGDIRIIVSPNKMIDQLCMGRPKDKAFSDVDSAAAYVEGFEVALKTVGFGINAIRDPKTFEVVPSVGRVAPVVEPR